MSARFASCAACLRTAAAVNGSRISGRPIIHAHRSLLQTAQGTTTPNIFLPVRHASTVATSEGAADAPQTLEAEPEATNSAKKEKERLTRIARRELKHMEDPYQIGKHVEVLLRRDAFDHALLFTQQASKNKKVVVAWNHLISYLFTKNEFKKAIKTYNEMKKRGQLPNVHTFTTIFRGCSKTTHSKLAVSEAFKHYNILLQDRRLEPNSIHLNAVLNVCARAGDVDAMFLVAKSINDTTRAANAQTYTTIFNGMRHHLLKTTQNLDAERRAETAAKIVGDAKRIWVEVLEKWRAGKLHIDEELVCAMGRLMLNAPATDPRRELMEVFELLQQTMNIPNFAASANATSPDSTTNNKGETASSAATTGTTGVVSKSGVYVKPSRNTLSLVLTAASHTKSTARVSSKYWNYLVQTHRIRPDEDNWLRMLGTLKMSKSSAEAAAVISLLDAKKIAAPERHYRIAMEACVRDNINPNVMSNATKVLDEMAARLECPDPQTMRLYVRVALVSHFHQRAKARDGDADDADAAKREYGMQIMKALEQLWEPYKAAHSYYFGESDGFGRDMSSSTNAGRKRKPASEEYNGQREVISLARLMYSAANKIINENMVPQSQLRVVKQFGGMINREIQRFFAKREDVEPKLRNKGKKNIKDTDQDESQYDEITVPETEDSSLRQGGDFVWNTSKAANGKTTSARK